MRPLLYLSVKWKGLWRQGGNKPNIRERWSLNDDMEQRHASPTAMNTAQLPAHPTHPHWLVMWQEINVCSVQSLRSKAYLFPQLALFTLLVHLLK